MKEAVYDRCRRVQENTLKGLYKRGYSALQLAEALGMPLEKVRLQLDLVPEETLPRIGKVG